MARTNRENPAAGRAFHTAAARLLEKYFGVGFHLDRPLEIGEPSKVHRFDFVSVDLRYVGECKNYSWTEGGNIPSAKMALINEALLYLSFVPKPARRYVAMRYDVCDRRSETLASYYYRTYGHLLGGTSIIEVDVDRSRVLEVSGEGWGTCA
jgi:hypothetical protein